MNHDHLAIATSSNGELLFDADTGEVLICDEYGCCSSNKQRIDGETSYLSNIAKFDVAEWRQAYPGQVLENVDILDLGYWTTAGDYEGPELEWRGEARALANT